MLGTADSPTNDSLELTSGEQAYARQLLPWPLAAQFKRSPTSMQHFLDPARVAATLPRIGTSIDTYCSLQRELHTRDVSADPDYQRRFTGYYRVRRNRAWRQAYFTLLQTHKVHGLPFEAALSAIAQAAGRVEASFASKLVATIDPHQPVVDSVVLRNLCLRLPASTVRERQPKVVAIYRRLGEQYAVMLASSEGRDAVMRVRQTYPHANLTDIKALDLLIWQTRDWSTPVREA